jgi:hypothetical protein
MKGMLDFLEKAGLVRQEAPAVPGALPDPMVGAGPFGTGQGIATSPLFTPQGMPAAPGLPAAVPSGPAAQAGTAAPRLEEIYAKEGVQPSPYPAERLLRLIDGLSAMDQATRDMTIKAIDAADESWTIADPLADAQAKSGALGAQAARVQAQLRQIEQETQSRLGALRARQDKVLGDIRKQTAELEALAARETARAAQESAALEMGLKSAKDRAAWELDALAQTRSRLQGLLAQYGRPGSGAAEPG